MTNYMYIGASIDIYSISVGINATAAKWMGSVPILALTLVATLCVNRPLHCRSSNKKI